MSYRQMVVVALKLADAAAVAGDAVLAETWQELARYFARKSGGY